MFGKRESCDLMVWIKRKSDLAQESLEKMQLSISKIGHLGFFSGEKGDGLLPGRLCDNRSDSLRD